MEQTAARERIFAEILNYNAHRILQRLSPDWYPAPPHWNAQQRRRRASLHDRLLNHVLPHIRDPSLRLVEGKLTDVVATLKPLEHSKAAESLAELVRRAVEACAEASTSPRRCLESQLGSTLAELSEAGRKAVYQIDKIARYRSMSKDLTKLAAGSSRQLFQNLMVKYISSPEPRKPEGAHETCSVHAEVQLILHYEKYPHHPSPRAMGCSKSACYLCDLFISLHGRYRISFAHRRLYPKWTIPNVVLSHSREAEAIRAVVRAMQREMERLLSLDRSSVLCALIESRACLLLSLDLTTRVTLAENCEDEEDVPTGSESSTTMTLTLHSRSKSVLRLGIERLPFVEELPLSCDAVQVALGTLTVFFDFEETPGPILSVTATAGLDDCARNYCVNTLPTGDDVTLFSDEDGRVRFSLYLAQSPVFEITLSRRLAQSS